jgi:hypothetical protein
MQRPLLLLACWAPVASAAANSSLLEQFGGLAFLAVGGTAYVANGAVEGAARNIGLNEEDIGTAENATQQAAYDVLSCSGHVGCVSCYGLASVGALVTSTATTAACGIFALACPIVFAYGVYVTSRDAVRVYHQGIEGIDPCRAARHDARPQPPLRSAGTGATSGDSQSLPSAAMLRLDPPAIPSMQASLAPDALAMLHLGSTLAAGTLAVLAVRKRLKSRAHQAGLTRLPRSPRSTQLTQLLDEADHSGRRVQWAHPVASLV